MSDEVTATATPEEKAESRFETICSLVITLVAASLAIVDLGAGRFGDDEMAALNQRAAQYQWYQSKSIKGSLSEGQSDLVAALLDGGAVNDESKEALTTLQTRLADKTERYDKEKNEILLGSKTVGEANWAQDVDGEMGIVTGAVEWDQQIEVLGDAGDFFDLSTFFLQVSLVIGAISLISRGATRRWSFFTLMTVLGVTGTIVGVMAYNIAISAPIV